MKGNVKQNMRLSQTSVEIKRMHTYTSTATSGNKQASIFHSEFTIRVTFLSAVMLLFILCHHCRWCYYQHVCVCCMDFWPVGPRVESVCEQNKGIRMRLPQMTECDVFTKQTSCWSFSASVQMNVLCDSQRSVICHRSIWSGRNANSGSHSRIQASVCVAAKPRKKFSGSAKDGEGPIVHQRLLTALGVRAKVKLSHWHMTQGGGTNSQRWGSLQLCAITALADTHFVWASGFASNTQRLMSHTRVH